jgi:hypothetical protein
LKSAVIVFPASNRDRDAADVLKKAQDLDDTEHKMLPFIERFKSIRQAVEKFGRI